MKTRIFLSSMLAGLALVLPVSTNAHADVASSTPAEGAVAKSVKAITLNFNEAMIPATTTAQLVMTAMPGMANHSPMQIKNFTTAWSNGDKTVTLALKTALRAGTYEVRWQGAGDDGHRMNGTVHFKVG